MNIKLANENERYIACVICSDTRALKWASLLIELQSAHSLQFEQVYVVLSEYDYRKFLPEATNGDIIANHELPASFDAIFFHSSNIALWQSLRINADYIFEFNTPGDPTPQQGIFPILRRTAPFFDIKLEDIQELFAFIAGHRKELPLCCTDPVIPLILPSLVSLCQFYMMNAQTDDRVQQIEFWQEALGYKPECEDPDWWTDWQTQLERECRVIGQSSAPQASTMQLWKTLKDSSAIQSACVTAAYTELSHKLGLQENINPTVKQPVEIMFALTIANNPAPHALATIFSHLWQIPRCVLPSATEPINWKMLHHSVLILAEDQIHLLKQLRLQGFSGAVVVISLLPFHILKKRHRVLRFGQGAHGAFASPWDLQKLLSDIAEMIPLAPENLHLLQSEVQASQQLYKKQMAPCLERLEKLEQSGRIAEEDLEYLEDAIGKIQAELPVACHSFITIEVLKGSPEKQRIPEHFRAALKKLRSQDNAQMGHGIAQFRQVCDHLQEHFLQAW